MAVGVVRAADHDREVQLAGRLRLETLDAHLHGLDHAVAERLRLAHEHAELGAIEARDAHRRPRARAREEGRAEHDRQLAEDLARFAPHRERALAVAVALHEVVRAGEQHEEDGRIALAHEPLTRIEPHVGGERGDARQRPVIHALEHGQVAQFVELDHAASSS